MYGARFENRVFAVTVLIAYAGQIEAMTLARADPTVSRHDNGQRLIQHLHFDNGASRLLDQRAPRIAVFLGVIADFADHQLFHQALIIEQFLQFLVLSFERFQLLLDLDAFEPRQLAQANFKNILGLNVAQFERRHQLRLGFIRVTNELDHFVDVQKNNVPALQDMDAPIHLPETELDAPGHRADTEADPLFEHQTQILALRPAVQADHHHVDREIFFERGMRHQQLHKLVGVLLGAARFKHQAHAIALVGLVVHFIERAEDELLQIALCRRYLAAFFARLGVGQLFKLTPYPHRRRGRRQFVYHHLPLPAREVLDSPAATRAQRAASVGVGIDYRLTRADKLRATGEIGPLDDIEQCFDADVGPVNHRHCSFSHFTQVVWLQLASHTHAHAGCAVEQQHRQPRGQQLRLFQLAVVVRHKIDRVLIDLGQQQLGDRGKPRLGITIRCCGIAILRAEVTLPVNQRITQ